MFHLYDTIHRGEVYIIAEMSANHGGRLENALEIVRRAADAGANCLKIQTYTADSMTIDCDSDLFRIHSGLWDGYTLYELYQEAGTPYGWHAAIRDECTRCGIDFLSTPFDPAAVDFLEELGAEAYKIASFELVDIPLIKYAAAKQKPMIISCGMSTPEEIQEAVDACHAVGNDKIVLLKCCSEYPAKWEDMNLRMIPAMRSHYGVPVGLSDHSGGSLADVTATALGACVIEKHVKLPSIESADSAFSMPMEAFAQMVQDVRNVTKMLGATEAPLSETERTSLVFRRSLFAVKDIAAGEPFTAENIRSIRPSYGLSPKHYEALIGTPSPRSFQRGEPIGGILPDEVH